MTGALDPDGATHPRILLAAYAARLRTPEATIAAWCGLTAERVGQLLTGTGPDWTRDETIALGRGLGPTDEVWRTAWRAYRAGQLNARAA